MRTPDVTIIGGGAIGAACAYELAAAGIKVALLERNVELGRGCSGGTAGLLAPTHATPIANPRALRDGLRWMMKRDSPFHIQLRVDIIPWLTRFTRAALSPGAVAERTRALRLLGTASLRLHAELADVLETTFERRGILYLHQSQQEFSRAQAEISGHALLGLRSRALTETEACGLEPAIRPTIAGAVFCEDEAHLNSLCFVRVLAKAARDHGAVVHTDTEVLACRVRKGRVVELRTTRGPMAVNEVVIAAGIWSRIIAAGLGLFLPLEGAKGYHIEFVLSEQDPHIPIFMQDARIIATPYPGRLRLAGTLDLSGFDESVDFVRVEAIRAAGERFLPSIDARSIAAVWRGVRPCTPDGVPYLGRPVGFHNLIIACGHAMNGVALAPVTARLVRSLVDETAVPYDTRLMDVNRFQPIFSRLARPIQRSHGYIEGRVPWRLSLHARTESLNVAARRSLSRRHKTPDEPSRGP